MWKYENEEMGLACNIVTHLKTGVLIFTFTHFHTYTFLKLINGYNNIF